MTAKQGELALYSFLVLCLLESCESLGHLGAAHVCVVLELSAARISILKALSFSSLISRCLCMEIASSPFA